MTLKLPGLKSLSYPLLLLPPILSVKWFNAEAVTASFRDGIKRALEQVCCSLAALSKENPRGESWGRTQSHRSRLSPKIHNKEE